jgi:hypothetical protein
MPTQSPPDPCAAPPEPCIPVRRNRYFTGKFMNALDFTNEQTYLVRRRWLHNRLLHGWGIACGLEVTPPPDDVPDACKNRVVIVQPGVAIDC